MLLAHAQEKETSTPKSRNVVRTDTRQVKVTIGRAHIVHGGLATFEYNEYGETVSRQVYETDCGTDVRRGRRSTFTITADRYETDCERCIKARG